MASRDAGGRTTSRAGPRTATLAAAALALVAAAAVAPGEMDVGRLVDGARLSVAKAPRYDGSYVRLAFPGGDPGWERGVCADLVIRAFRHAGIDLQARLYDDVLSRPADYGLHRPDPNIDHRRVRHLRTYFARHARRAVDFQPGDIVIWDLKGGTTPNHIGIVSDRRGRDGEPLVIHHMNEVGPFTGRPGEDDSLHRWPIVAHFRWSAGR